MTRKKELINKNLRISMRSCDLVRRDGEKNVIITMRREIGKNCVNNDSDPALSVVRA